MSRVAISAYEIPTAKDLESAIAPGPVPIGRSSSASLAAAITKEASAQTHATIRYLVDRPLVGDAFRAYAYFRWVDDTLDQGQMSREDRLSFLARQNEIIARCRQGERQEDLCPEERIVADLLQNHPAVYSGLQIYIDQMMAVMVFDAQRRGRLISQEELDQYAHFLATAVTEAMHYFIGHDHHSPNDDTRYAAVTGAHITHMLRDTIEDAAAGYCNAPQALLEAHNIAPTDVHHEAYRSWVRERVELARELFSIGRDYMARVENWRCRLAGYAYIARFEVVLDAIEKEEYVLRSAYPERKSFKARLKMMAAAVTQTLRTTRLKRLSTIPEPVAVEIA